MSMAVLMQFADGFDTRDHARTKLPLLCAASNFAEADYP
jgi:hypothetical protein